MRLQLDNHGIGLRSSNSHHARLLDVAERQRFGQALLKILLQLHAQVDEGDVQLFVHGTGQPYATIKGSPYGVSLSHSRGSWYAAALPDAQVGIDVERRWGFPATLPVERFTLSDWEQCQRLMLEEEPAQAFLRRRWTLKEAYAKATGQGLHFPFPSLSFQHQEHLNSAYFTPVNLMGTDGTWMYWSAEDIQDCTFGLCWRNAV
ncbi:4'-phosphopantetheinyl transferase family protein [Deinococcus hopiensis]|uniref:Phosphopantetheinyl transferase n=1 Tax=Deinococcus hopiensis KR-140 TaxID=695939 RepID=A0A1W1U9M0_9DEIO|nr:4'-phosphopantetheinyl transferase superfamily protein [Deinococcus hopiensis]SMB77767.1 Phosphopantetheinyl transferase [Deinococcus hopiensis KR-140]